MSKEDILDKYPSQVQGDYYERHCLDAMDEYAEKVAVAFAEWLSKNYIQVPHGFGWRIYDHEEELWVYRNTSDIYKYFITNVYNK